LARRLYHGSAAHRLIEDTSIAPKRRGYRSHGSDVVGLNRLTGYLLREILTSWLAVTLVLVLVLLTNRLIDFMADAAQGDIPPDIIFTMLGLKAAANVGVVLPGSFFLALVLALGRLYRDSEMTAMAGCGIGPGRVYRGILGAAVPLVVVVGALTLTVGPAAERKADQVLAEARQSEEFAGVQPGQFQAFGDETVVYTSRLDGQGRMQAVFAERRLAEGLREIWVAEGGRRAVDELAPGEFLLLTDGHRYRGVAGDGAWQTLGFEEYGVRLGEPRPVDPGVGLDALPLMELAALPDPIARAELFRRVSFPLMVILLAVGSLPLAKAGPRSGRYGRVVSAVLLFMLYFNLLFAVSDWVVRQGLPVWLGVLSVHGAALVIVLLALRFVMGLRLPRVSP